MDNQQQKPQLSAEVLALVLAAQRLIERTSVDRAGICTVYASDIADLNAAVKNVHL